jgi:hypothetical protein
MSCGYRSLQNYGIENYSYIQNEPRSTYELLLTPSGPIRNNPTSAPPPVQPLRAAPTLAPTSPPILPPTLPPTIIKQPSNISQDLKEIERVLDTTVERYSTDNQPYSYGYPYATYKANDLYSYYPKSNLSGVI